jgi:hypothetical protein
MTSARCPLVCLLKPIRMLDSRPPEKAPGDALGATHLRDARASIFSLWAMPFAHRQRTAEPPFSCFSTPPRSRLPFYWRHSDDQYLDIQATNAPFLSRVSPQPSSLLNQIRGLNIITTTTRTNSMSRLRLRRNASKLKENATTTRRHHQIKRLAEEERSTDFRGDFDDRLSHHSIHQTVQF